MIWSLNKEIEDLRNSKIFNLETKTWMNVGDIPTQPGAYFIRTVEASGGLVTVLSKEVLTKEDALYELNKSLAGPPNDVEK